MTLDPTTLFVVAGLISIVCGTAFVLDTLLRRNDNVGRLWSVFFIAGMFVVFSYIISMLDTGAWWAFAPANGGYALAVGMVWSGARAANGRRPLVVVPLAVGVAVAVATLLPGPHGGYWAGSVEMFAAIALFAGAGAVESLRRDMGRLLSGRILAIMLAAMGLYYVGRTTAIVVLGPGDPTFETFFGTSSSTLFEICLVVVATMTLSSIQADRFDKPRDDGKRPSDGTAIDGVLGMRAFREFAESWLLRSLRERTTLVLLVLEIADLDEINVAFGRAAGDGAIRLTARIATTTAPTAVLIGRLSAGRFGLLMKLPTETSVEAVADRIGDAVLNAPIDDQDRFRVTTFRGIATTRTAGSRYDDLLRAASDAVAQDAAAARAHAATAAGIASADS